MFARGKLAAAYRADFLFTIGMMKAAEGHAARRASRDFLPFVWIPRIADFDAAERLSLITYRPYPTTYRFSDGITAHAALRQIRRA